MTISLFAEKRLPNELGEIPIITYHKISDRENKLNRKPQNMKADLEFFYKHDFVLVPLLSLVNGEIDIAFGKSPLVITFDDSSFGQFHWSKKGTIDPSSGIGIIEEFKKQHPDFGGTATFFVTPCQGYPNNLFGEPEHTKEKLNQLLDLRYEIANHTCNHPNFQDNPELVEKEIALSLLKIRDYLPEFEYAGIATPFGGFPKDKTQMQKLIFGEFRFEKEKKTIFYKNKYIADYSNRFSLSPFHKKFNPFRIRRLHWHEKAFQKFKLKLESGAVDLYVSDGSVETITIPRHKQNEIALDTKRRTIQTY